MTPQKALRRYVTIVAPAMIAYAVLLIWCISKFNALPQGEVLPSYLAVLPGLPMLLVGWAMARFLREGDEFMRSEFARHLFIGMAIVALLSFVWGFLEEFGGWPHIPLYMIIPFSFFCMGMSQLAQSVSRGLSRGK